MLSHVVLNSISTDTYSLHIIIYNYVFCMYVAQSVTACSQYSVVQSTSQQSSVTVTQQEVVHDVMSTDGE